MLASDLVDFTLASQSAVRLVATPSGFSPSLAVRPASIPASYIFTNWNFGEIASQRWILPSNTYRAIVGTKLFGEVGAYVFTGAREAEDNPSCEYTYLLGLSLSTVQHLAPGDCDSFGQLSDYFRLFSPRSCTITMRSNAFDAYLEVYDQDNNLLASDDDSGGGNDARVTLPACLAQTQQSPHQVISIRATSYVPGQQGTYTLQIQIGLSSVLSINASPLSGGAQAQVERLPRLLRIPDRPPKKNLLDPRRP